MTDLYYQVYLMEFTWGKWDVSLGMTPGAFWERTRRVRKGNLEHGQNYPIGSGFDWLKKSKKITRVTFPLLCLLVYANISKQSSTSTVMPSLTWWADYTLETSAKPNPSSIKFLLLRYFATEVKKYLTGACGWGVCSWATGGSKHPHQQSLIMMGKLRQFCLFQVPLPLAHLDLFNAEKFLINQTSRDIISGD